MFRSLVPWGSQSSLHLEMMVLVACPAKEATGASSRHPSQPASLMHLLWDPHSSRVVSQVRRRRPLSLAPVVGSRTTTTCHHTRPLPCKHIWQRTQKSEMANMPKVVVRL